MPAAPLPSDERERLAALRALQVLGLDDKPEERFDRITRLIRNLLDVPVALITVVDEEIQWYKSNSGMAGSGSARDQSFCAYTILSDEPLVVPDARLDPRFADNPAAFASPSIRFYAGLPLHASNGQRLGALCAIDSRPRSVSDRELNIMRSLAGIAEAELNSFGLAQAMRRLLQQENQFRNLVEHSSDLIHTFDAEGRILYANPAWRAALGYSARDIEEGLSLFEVVHPDFIPAARERLRRIFAGETLPRFESQLITSGGHCLEVEGNVTAYEQQGLPHAACSIFRDITARKALEEESRRAQHEAEQVSLAKSQFLANISHEIRTPLNGITGMSSMLTLSGLTEQQLRYARTIESSGRVLLSLVNQILDFSKLDAGAARLERISFSLPHLVDEVIALFAMHAEEKKLSLRSHIASDVPPVLAGDPERLRQVLTNLIGNAVKFTEAGEVRLDIRLEAQDDSSGETLLLRFTVIDTGIGLDPAASSHIFDAFAQADPSTTRKYGGTGLGLAISRQIVRLMGGDISVQSAPGEGATFWFTARFHPATSARAAAPAQETLPAPPPARSLRILVAEDNAVNQLVLSEQLNTLGHTSTVVSNGHEALAALDGAHWDAVLLDCQMPVMDGYETVAAIRKREAAGAPRLWVVAVTANAISGQREVCTRAGMDDFLSKPFSFQQLAQVISRIPAAADTAPPPPVDIARLEDLAASKAVNGENLLDRMTGLFTVTAPEMLDQMDQAIASDDLISAVRAAHKLAGGCGYFGAAVLHSLCGDLERLGRDGNAIAVTAIIPRIREEYARVQTALIQARQSLPAIHEDSNRRG